MAHFAQLDENNTVLQVIVVNNEDCGGGDFPESEPIGQAFILSIGLSGTWKQTSYSSSFRKRYAGIGYTYNQDTDEYITPKPFPSWVLNANNDWQAPTPRPDGNFYWDEETVSWLEIPAGS